MFEVKEASVRAICGPVEEETVSAQAGVVVPMPTFLLESTTSPVPPTVRSEEKRLVEEAVVAKKLVEVALVVVELPLAMKSPF